MTLHTMTVYTPLFVRFVIGHDYAGRLFDGYRVFYATSYYFHGRVWIRVGYTPGWITRPTPYALSAGNTSELLKIVGSGSCPRVPLEP